MGAQLSRQWPFPLSPHLSSAEGMVMPWGWSLLHPRQHPHSTQSQAEPQKLMELWQLVLRDNNHAMAGIPPVGLV